MANDRKIKDNFHAAGSKFLPSEIANVDEGRDIYSLENEFAKTRKNINWLVIILVLMFLSGITLFALFFKQYTDRKDREIDIDIAEFDDVRLKDILHSSKMVENNILIKSNELESSIIKMRNQVLVVNNTYLSKINAVLDQSLPFAETNEKILELKNSEQNEIKKIKAQYESVIYAKRQELNKLQNEKREEEAKLAQIKEGGTSITDEDKIYQIKMKSLYDASSGGLGAMADYYDRYTKYLVLKYNHVFSTSDLKANIEKNSKANEKRNLREYDPIFNRENVISRSQFDNIREKISDQNKIIQRLNGIGYENSIPPALKSIDNLSVSITNDYENLWYNLASAVRYKNSQIEYYKIALDAALKERPESGYIISVENSNRVIIHMNRLLTVKEGDTGFVFRTDDKYIGKIEFYRANDGLKGKVIELADSQKMEPFDRILIKIK